MIYRLSECKVCGENIKIFTDEENNPYKEYCSECKIDIMFDEDCAEICEKHILN